MVLVWRQPSRVCCPCRDIFVCQHQDLRSITHRPITEKNIYAVKKYIFLVDLVTNQLATMHTIHSVRTSDKAKRNTDEQ